MNERRQRGLPNAAATVNNILDSKNIVDSKNILDNKHIAGNRKKLK